MTTTPDINAQSSDHIGFHSCATVPTSLARQLKLERDQALAGKAAAERQRDVLLEALELLDSRWKRDGEGDLEFYERIADLFQKKHVYLAPGKDDPFTSVPLEERRAAWDAFLAEPSLQARAAIASVKEEI